MSTLSVISRETANYRGAETDTNNTHFGAINAAVIRACRKVFPVKTWLYVSDFLGLSERTSKHRMAGSREFTVGELGMLLRSEHGLTILSAVMADATPPWWKAFKQQIAITDARKLERAARRRLQEAIDADADLTSAISRAEALSDEDFVRPHSDALRTMARVPNRAVAQAAKGRGR